MKRVAFFLFLLVVLAVAVAVAAVAVPTNALSVNGDVVSQTTLNGDLKVIAQDSAFQCYLATTIELSGGDARAVFPVVGAGATTAAPTTYNSAFAREWLDTLAQDLLVSQQLARLHLNAAVTPAVLTLAQQYLTSRVAHVLSELQTETQGQESCGAQSSQLLGGLPTDFYHSLVVAEAEQMVLVAHEAKTALTTGALGAYFAANSSEFDELCLEGVGFTTHSAATAALAKAKAGTPFTQIGQIATLGCGGRQTVAAQIPGATSLTVGQVLGPTTVSGTEALLRVKSITPVSYTTPAHHTTERRSVVAAVLAAGSARTAVVLEGAGRRATVVADPRYGQVQPKTVVLAANPSPTPKFVLNPAANLPVTSATGAARPSTTGESGAGG